MFYKRVGPSYPKSRLAAPIGRRVDVFVDPSVAEQVYVEDCYVCCRPILLSVRVGTDDEVAIEARQENGAVRPIRKRFLPANAIPLRQVTYWRKLAIIVVVPSADNICNYLYLNDSTGLQVATWRLATT